MHTLCDVNILLALCYERHEHHPTALRWLATQQDFGSILICRAAHLSLLRLLNNPAVMGRDACTCVQVWQISDQFYADDRFAFAEEPAGVEVVMRQLTSSRTFTPKVWQDAYLAAFAIKAGISFATFDRGFSKFKDLSLQLLL